MGPPPLRRKNLIAYDFRDRRKAHCYKCGHDFPEGRYREHVMQSTNPAHADDKRTEKR